MLLSIAKHPPHHCGEIQILRDKITAFFDMRVNWWQCCINGTVKAGKDADSFQALLSDITAEIISKSRAGTKRKAIIFINDLDCTRMILPDGQKTSAKKVKAGIEYSMEYDTDSIIFRNFNVLFNNKTEKIMKMFPGFTCCVGMQKFLDMFGLPITELRYSLAYLTKKTFYADIKEELWQNTRMHRRILRDIATYSDMQAGNQGGMLSSFSGDNCIIFKVLNNVASFDKKSAYPSYFINDKYFPIGKICRVTGAENYKKIMLADAIKKRQWFKIVIADDLSYMPELQIFKTPEKELYGIEFWDYRIIQKCGIDILGLLSGKKWRLYRCTFTGYMPDCFREKIIKLYDRKNAIVSKDDPERFLIKTQLDMLYGKGLQKYEFATDQDVFRKYLLRGENFLTPQMSMHVVAAMRHELLTVAGYFGKDCFAYDTDGVKIDVSPGQLKDITAFFDKINAYIKDKNAAAGFNSDIGIWDFEYMARRFIQFAPKVYAYEEYGGGVVCKFAGVAERYTKKYIGDKTPDELFSMWSSHGLDLQTCAGWCFVPEKKWFIELKNDYKLLKESEEK